MSYDILSIDSKIKESFKKKYEKLDNYNKKLKDLNETLKKSKLNPRLLRDVKKNIEEIEIIIKSINSREKYNFYIAETASLLESYKKILSTPQKLSFMGKSSRNNKEKGKIINKYLEIAQKYDDNPVEPPTRHKKVSCTNCSNKKLFDIIDDSIYICLKCGAQQAVLVHTASYKDIDRINISVKYTYDRKVHFRDCINQYQGKQNSTIDKAVFEGLTEEFRKHHLLEGKEGDPKEKRFGSITKHHIHLFLKELEYTKHYENVNLIHYQITGKKPDDISYLEDRLLEDFDKLTDLYDKKFKNKPGFDRKNFINTQYVLYQLLLRYNHPCNKEDFTILKTVDRKSFHDDICQVCFQALSWNHFPIF
jgi:ribosomal protein L37AE/L43A